MNNNESLFISCGELSGERVARWYLDKIQPQGDVFALGGALLEERGVSVIERYHNYSAIGITEILTRIPDFYRLGNRLVDFIIQNKCTTVWLVDFSGFHIPLAKRLKRANPALKIVYLAPPHCWSWAEWKINDLKKLCDDIVVLYPFEVAWYAARGLKVRYLGSLVYEDVMPHYNAALPQQKHIVFMPGSRKREVEALMPLFNEVIKNSKVRYPDFEFSTICADSIDLAALEKLSVAPVVRQGAEAYRLVQQALCVVTKPGTVTLELGLLGVPVIAVYKPSWLTYFLAKMVVKLRFASLPSIMSNKKIYPEIISPSLSAGAIEQEIVDLIEHPETRDSIKSDLAQLREQF